MCNFELLLICNEVFELLGLELEPLETERVVPSSDKLFLCVISNFVSVAEKFTSSWCLAFWNLWSNLDIFMDYPVLTLLF